MKSKIILPPIQGALPRSDSVANDKWQALCALHNVPSDHVPEAFVNLVDKLKLTPNSPVWDQIVIAYNNRSRNSKRAQEALDEMLKLGPELLSTLNPFIKNLQGRFIAMFASQEFEPAAYHFYGHGKEMSEDPGNLLRNIVPNNEFGKLMRETVNALGAAHDIIQSAGAPYNEIASAEIFVAEMQKAIDNFIDSSWDLSEENEKILMNYRNFTIPFLAQECIVNSTYLLFAQGKRDFENILTQITAIMEQAHLKTHGKLNSAMHLSQEVNGMKLAMSLADTRRSEIKYVLRNMTTLRMILTEDDNKPILIKLLVAAGILKEGAPLPALDTTDEKAQIKLMRIEGFLLRLGQNVRMTSELAVHFKKDSTHKILLEDIRGNQPHSTNYQYTFENFIKTIPGDFGEASFAKALGELNITELPRQIDYYDLKNMVDEHNFDFHGWERHSNNLSNLHANAEKFTAEDKFLIGELIFYVAAKPPGHKVGQDVFNAMTNYRKELIESNPQLLSNLDNSLTEIKASDPSLTMINIDNLISEAKASQLTSARSTLGRPRIYSDPTILRRMPSSASASASEESNESMSPMSPSSPKSQVSKISKFKPTNAEPTPYEIGAKTRRGSLNGKSTLLPPIQKKKGMKKAVSHDDISEKRSTTERKSRK